jgi:Domain of unknown function (DUF6398)
MDKKQIQEKQEKLLELVRSFCIAKLDNEYREVCEHLVKKLGRKRNVIFIAGQLEIWAAAVIHAVGTVNFLFDKSNEPYASIDDINNFFGTKKTTTGGKSKIIRDLFKMRYWDDEFSTKTMQKSNPYANMVSINGMILPISALPPEIQEEVKEAKKSGKSFTIRF